MTTPAYDWLDDQFVLGNTRCQTFDWIGEGEIDEDLGRGNKRTRTFWQIGHDIVEFEQGGQTRATYGQALIKNLSHDLRLRHGKGFSRSNVIRARQFYLAYPKGATLSHLLSWSHVVELLKLDDPLERGFYEQQCAREKWAVRELQRQIKSSLFLRLAVSGHDDGAIALISLVRTDTS